MPSAYIDISAFQRGAFGVATANFIGGNSVLSASVAVGATALSVTNGTGFSGATVVYMLDGPNTEIVNVASSSGTTITLVSPGCTYAHAAGVNASSAGPSGALASAILQASVWAENYCQRGTPTDRSLWIKSYTETLRMPSMRAYLDRSGILVLAPYQNPITAITALTLEFPGPMSMELDISQAIIPDSLRTIQIPAIIPATGLPLASAFAYWNPLTPSQAGWAQMTYTAGFGTNLATVPWDIQQATTLAAQEFLAYAQNPTGAAMVRQGDVMIVQRLRGSGNQHSSTDGIFLAQARAILEPYKRKQ